MFTRSNINVPNEKSLSKRSGRKNGSSTDITSNGFFFRKPFLSLEIVKFKFNKKHKEQIKKDIYQIRIIKNWGDSN